MVNSCDGIGEEGLPMPWNEICAMNEHMRFIAALQPVSGA
jgi:hypothetical protein